MAKEKMKSYSLADMKDEFIGKVGTKERDDYEYELRMDVLGKMIKTARQERNLTQEQLAELVGVRRETIVFLEQGKYNPSLNLAHKVAQTLQTTIDNLFDFED